MARDYQPTYWSMQVLRGVSRRHMFEVARGFIAVKKQDDFADSEEQRVQKMW
jgi:hypothetical protein